MKRQLKSTLTAILLPLAVTAGAIVAIEEAQATPVYSMASRSIITPFRANFEEAIAMGLIGRPSLVKDEYHAMVLAENALGKGDRPEAARRYAQALVIISETRGATQALAVERSLDAEMLQDKGQTLRDALPDFGLIFPFEGDPYQ